MNYTSFCDGTLNDVRTALNDHLKGIRMKYLTQTIWRQSDRDKAGAMIQAIDKQLKTRRIMRSLEKFIGGRPLETDSLDFEDVYFVNELKFNLFSVSQMCDKKNYVIFTDTECLVLSPNFKLPDESQILLKIPRKDNMYSFDMKNIVPKESLTCLVAKATSDESMLWHRRLGHINFKNINKLVKDNLVRGLPTKHFENDQTCVACLKGKQHRASLSHEDLDIQGLIRIYAKVKTAIPTRKGIEKDDYDLKGENLILEELAIAMIPLSIFPKKEFISFDCPSYPSLAAKPSDDDEIEPDTGVFTKVVDDNSDNSTRELYIHVPNVLPNLPILSLDV
ncbi:putative ribonuclease H-like domain-containing protein [Tanacetum coccineum]